MNFINDASSRILINFANETGDILPDELTTIVLHHLSLMTWITNYSQVCRKWYRLINAPALWETVSKKYNIPILLMLDTEMVTLEFKKQIYRHWNIEASTETKEGLFNKIKIICNSMQFNEITEIIYTSAQNVNAYIKIFMVKFKFMRKNNSSVLQPLGTFNLIADKDIFNEREKRAHIYRIRGEREADFDAKEATFNPDINTNNYSDLQRRYPKSTTGIQTLYGTDFEIEMVYCGTIATTMNASKIYQEVENQLSHVLKKHFDN